MSIEIGGVGAQVQLVASNTFPSGISIDQGADDADYIDIPVSPVGDAAMGVNGDLLTWGKANRLDVTLNVAPDGDNDQNLAILLDMNRVGRGKISVRDSITMVITYPNGKVVSFLNGKILSGPPADSVTSAGRFKTKPYMFTFEQRIGSY